MRSRFGIPATIDWALLLVAGALTAIGIAAVTSASFDPATKSFGDFCVRQAFWIAGAAVVFVLVLIPNYRTYMKYSYLLFGALLVALVAVLLFGETRNNARRWIDLHYLLWQPSEFMKIAYVLALSKYLMYRQNYKTLKGLVGPFALTFVPVVLILRQPDLGMAMIFLPVLFIMLYAAGAKLSHLAAACGAGLAALPPMYIFVLKEYQRSRLLAFAFPDRYAQTHGYHLIQSKIAIGSGGLTGKGWIAGTQNVYDFLPAKHNDFVFSILAEEFGLLGVTVLFVLFFLFIVFCLRAAAHTKEPFGRLVVVGATSLFAVQVVVNIAVTTGLLPTKGLTLPFISYGGSSLVSSFILLGLITNVGMRRTITFTEEDDFD